MVLRQSRQHLRLTSMFWLLDFHAWHLSLAFINKTEGSFSLFPPHASSCRLPCAAQPPELRLHRRLSPLLRPRLLHHPERTRILRHLSAVPVILVTLFPSTLDLVFRVSLLVGVHRKTQCCSSLFFSVASQARLDLLSLRDRSRNHILLIRLSLYIKTNLSESAELFKYLKLEPEYFPVSVIP